MDKALGFIEYSIEDGDSLDDNGEPIISNTFQLLGYSLIYFVQNMGTVYLLLWITLASYIPTLLIL